MKIVKWEDKEGYKHCTLLRDNDDITNVSKTHGISQDPPPVQSIDWDAVKRDLHNQLLARGIITFEDVQHQQDGVTAAVRTALVRRVIQLYKEHNK